MLTQVCFKLPSKYAKDAQQAVLVGEFNDWKIEKGIALKKNDDGSMYAEISLAGGRTYQYRYYLGNGRWVNDDSRKTSTMAYGMNVENCLVEVPKILQESKDTNVISTQKEKVITKTKRVKSKQDDLTQILGINQSIAKVLYKEGIHTYVDLSKCTMKKLLLILSDAGLTQKARHLTSWTRQAKLAATGKISEWDDIKSAIKG